MPRRAWRTRRSTASWRPSRVSSTALRALKGGNNGAHSNGSAKGRSARGEHRGFVRRNIWSLAGGLAVAAAVIAFVLSRAPVRQQVAKVVPPAPTQSASPSPSVPTGPELALAGVSNQASIESIDVPGAASAIFTIPDDSGDGDTTVIWLTASADDAGEEVPQ
jgi:hypothetical protein